MISQELKDQIDDIATDIAVLETGKERRQEINAALIDYAEKLEEKDKEIEQLKQQAIFSEEIEKQLQIRIEQDLGKLESKDRELAQLKEKLSKLKNEKI